MNSIYPIANLPKALENIEILLYIFSYLSVKDCLKCSLVCRLWCKTVRKHFRTQNQLIISYQNPSKWVTFDQVSVFMQAGYQIDPNGNSSIAFGQIWPITFTSSLINNIAIIHNDIQDIRANIDTVPISESGSVKESPHQRYLPFHTDCPVTKASKATFDFLLGSPLHQTFE